MVYNTVCIMAKERNHMIFDTRDNVSLWLRIIAVALSVAIVITGGLAIVWEMFLGRINYDPNYNATVGSDIHSSTIVENPSNNVDPDENVEPDDEPDDDPDNSFASETIHPSVLTNLKSNMKSWMNNGDPVRDNDVINILFIGMENNNDYGKPQPLSVNGRADAMCIASVNKKTKTITLASLLRDQYSYIIMGNSGRYTKFHHALSYSGPEKQIEMIERYYKVVIDNYVIVNFDSLPKIIDAVGGIDIDINKDEAYYLKNTCGWKIDVREQSMHVDGGHALTYMRIRKGNTGGDEARTGRQQKVMMTLVDMVKNYSTAQMVSLVNEVIPYVRTGLNSNDILAYAITALSEGWLKYEMKQLTLPDSTCCKPFKNPADGGDYWKVDYPVAAQKLQMALFGKSNITLDKDRKPWV